MRSGFASTVSLVAAVIVSLAAGEASAQSDTDSLHSQGQFIVNVQAGMGYRAIFPYDNEFCGELEDTGMNKSNCLGRSPFALNLGIGYAALDKLHVFADILVGLERDFGQNRNDADGPRIVAISPGIRGYISEQGNTRFFSTLQLMVDVSDYPQFDEADLGIRNVNGYQIDLHQTFGIYAYFGEVVSWKRWLRFEVDLGIGLQARFP